VILNSDNKNFTLRIKEQAKCLTPFFEHDDDDDDDDDDGNKN
jgi:hypothetical protein